MNGRRSSMSNFWMNRVKQLHAITFCWLALLTCLSEYHETVFSLGIFCFTKKADNILLLRTGAQTISRWIGLSNDLKAVKGLEPSKESCKLSTISNKRFMAYLIPKRRRDILQHMENQTVFSIPHKWFNHKNIHPRVFRTNHQCRCPITFLLHPVKTEIETRSKWSIGE